MELKDIKDLLEAKSKEIAEANAKLMVEVEAKGGQVDELKTALDKAVNDFEALDKKLIEVELAQKNMFAAKTTQKKTLGNMFVGSDVFEGMKANNRASNQPFVAERKNLTSLAASAGALVRPDRDPEVYRDPSRPLRIRDLIPAIPVASGSVEIMRQNVFTNNAGPQQATSSPSAAIGGGELLAKNQSNVTWELVTVPVRTIAHWLPASRQVLSDAPMLANLIDTELTYGLDLESDAQLLLGDGTGQNLTGLLVDAGVTDIGELPVGTTVANTPAAMIDHIRKAVTACQANEYYNMTGIVLNPTDWQRLETAKATDGHYLMIQFPANGADQRIWRMPVIVTNAMPADTFLLGDWTLGAKLYEREDVSVRVSESHADLFVRNGVAVLAEERYCLGINRPKAFAKGAFTVETE